MNNDIKVFEIRAGINEWWKFFYFIIVWFFQEKIFSIWLNTHFVYEDGKKISNGVDMNAVYDRNSTTQQTQVRQR